MKFLHAGDVHLGAVPESGTGLGILRSREIWDAFRDIIEICEHDRVDLLLLPGDLFHSQPLLKEVKEVDYLFRRLTHTKVVMCAGNHDFLHAKSHYYDVTFPEHVTFLTDPRADSVYLPELNVEVFGLSYETKQISEPRYHAIKPAHPERINILLAHGNVLCNDKSIPIRKESILAAGFDYVALGHLHNRIEIDRRVAYSGSLEPLNRGETGEKGYILGEVTKEGKMPSKIDWKFIPHAKRQYLPLRVEVTPESTDFSLLEELLEKINRQGTEHMYLVTLSGTRAREKNRNAETLASLLEGRGVNVISITDETVPDFSVETLREQHRGTLVGKFIRQMEETEDKTLGSKALQYGLQALLGRDES